MLNKSQIQRAIKQVKKFYPKIQIAGGSKLVPKRVIDLFYHSGQSDTLNSRLYFGKTATCYPELKTIIISDSFLRTTLTTLSQLVFVLGHELAHIQLQKNRLDEYACDRWAVGFTKRAGFQINEKILSMAFQHCGSERYLCLLKYLERG